MFLTRVWTGSSLIVNGGIMTLITLRRQQVDFLTCLFFVQFQREGAKLIYSKQMKTVKLDIFCNCGEYDELIIHPA